MSSAQFYELKDLPLILTVQEAANVLRIGKNSMYELVRAKQVRSLHIGRKIRISRDALQEYLLTSN